MRLLLALLFSLACALPASAESLINFSTTGGSAATCADSVPAQAAAQGFNTETFCTNTFSTANTDVNLTLNPSFSWFPLNCFGSADPGPAMAVAFNSGKITLGNPAIRWGWISSAQCPGTNPPYWKGTAYGGGMYWEATVQFIQTGAPTGNPFPAMWMQAAESFSAAGGGNPAAHWPGQAAGYDHFDEVDVVEYKGGGTTTDRCNHDWYGLHSGGFSWANHLDVCDFPNQTTGYFNTAHTYGILWVPATAGSNGELVWYVDGSVVKTITYAQFVTTNCQASSTQCPPPVAPASSPGIIDSDHMVLIFEGGSGTVSTGAPPEIVSNVHVFQVSAANNIKQ